MNGVRGRGAPAGRFKAGEGVDALRPGDRSSGDACHPWIVLDNDAWLPNGRTQEALDRGRGTLALDARFLTPRRSREGRECQGEDEAGCSKAPQEGPAAEAHGNLRRPRQGARYYSRKAGS